MKMRLRVGQWVVCYRDVLENISDGLEASEQVATVRRPRRLNWTCGDLTEIQSAALAGRTNKTSHDESELNRFGRGRYGRLRD
jgi:hypothetical protein